MECLDCVFNTDVLRCVECEAQQCRKCRIIVWFDSDRCICRECFGNGRITCTDCDQDYIVPIGQDFVENAELTCSGCLECEIGAECMIDVCHGRLIVKNYYELKSHCDLCNYIAISCMDDRATPCAGCEKMICGSCVCNCGQIEFPIKKAKVF